MWLFYCNWLHTCLTPHILCDMTLLACRSYRLCNIKHKLSERKYCWFNMYYSFFYCSVYGKNNTSQSRVGWLLAWKNTHFNHLSSAVWKAAVTVGWDYSMVCGGFTALEPALLVAQSCGAKIAWYEWKNQTIPSPQTGTFFPVKSSEELCQSWHYLTK